MTSSAFGPIAIPSLEVRGFRAFEDLRIDRFQRVNLIVGKNNVGKSTLLEAIRVYAEAGDPNVLRNILMVRGELALDDEDLGRDELERLIFAYARLFFGRDDFVVPSRRIEMGPVQNPHARLWISLGFVEGPGDPGQLKLIETREATSLVAARPALIIRQGDSQELVVPLETTTRFYRRRLETDSRVERDTKCVVVAANGMSPSRIGQLWDRIALTDLEEYVLQGLRLITPEIERLSLIASGERANARTVVLKVAGFRRPVPLQSMGDGSNRMLGIILALVNARNGILLIDEIENGIHYSVQREMWRLVFSLARQLGVQVFATSHSYDCIRAFQLAATADLATEGLLVRLERRGAVVRSVPFDEHELSVANREHIEVR